MESQAVHSRRTVAVAGRGRSDVTSCWKPGDKRTFFPSEVRGSVPHCSTSGHGHAGNNGWNVLECGCLVDGLEIKLEDEKVRRRSRCGLTSS